MDGVSPPDGFRVYSAFTTFVYSQLQFILPDSFLGDISHWDHFMSIDLTSPDLPIKSVADFMQNKDFAKLVAESDLPTPTRFIEQAICFHKNLCILLLKHKVSKSKLVRGFSVFDEAVIRYGEEVDYAHESELLCDYLAQQKWISHTTKPLVLSEYGAFVEKFRSHSFSYEGERISFMSKYYELHCRENLFTVFKLCTLSLSGVHVIPSVFTIELLELASDSREFQSCVRSIQSSLVGVPNVSELYHTHNANPRTVSSVFSLLGKGRTLLENAYLSVWDLTSSCSSRRRRISNHFDSRYSCTISDEEKSWVALHDKPQSASSSPIQSPKTPEPSKFVAPTPIQSGPEPTGATGKITRKSPVLATSALSSPRYRVDVPILPESRPVGVKKLVVRRKKGDKK